MSSGYSPKRKKTFEMIEEYYRNNPPNRGYTLNKKELSSKLRKLRKELGLNQSQFAMIYGIELGTLQNWEQEKYIPDTTARSYLETIFEDCETTAKNRQKRLKKEKEFEIS